MHFIPPQCKRRYLSEIRVTLTPHFHALNSHIAAHANLNLPEISEYILVIALIPLSIHCHFHVTHRLLSLFLLVERF